jgi:hypothetical protein
LGAAGAVAFVRGRAPRLAKARILVWMLLPLALCSLSSARSARYIFPILVPLALCAGHLLQAAWPRFSRAFATWVVPALALVAAAILWIAPDLLARDPNASFERDAGRLRELVPADGPLAYWGRRYWRQANPLLYYADRALEQPAASPEAACRSAEERGGLLFCDRDALPDIEHAAPGLRALLEGPGWMLLQLGARGD